jgi:hypothetical protein
MAIIDLYIKTIQKRQSGCLSLSFLRPVIFRPPVTQGVALSKKLEYFGNKKLLTALFG